MPLLERQPADADDNACMGRHAERRTNAVALSRDLPVQLRTDVERIAQDDYPPGRNAAGLQFADEGAGGRHHAARRTKRHPSHCLYMVILVSGRV